MKRRPRDLATPRPAASSRSRRSTTRAAPRPSLLRLLSRLAARGWQVTLTTPVARTAARGGARRRPRLERATGRRLGAADGRARGRAPGPGCGRWPGSASVVYLNGAVCGRLLPALPAGRRTSRPARPRHRQPGAALLARGPMSSWPTPRRSPIACTGLPAQVVYAPVEPDPPVAAAPWADGGGPVIGFVGPDRAPQGPPRPRPRRTR